MHVATTNFKGGPAIVRGMSESYYSDLLEAWEQDQWASCHHLPLLRGLLRLQPDIAMLEQPCINHALLLISILL